MSINTLSERQVLTLAALQFAIEARHNDDFDFEAVATYGARLFTDPKNHAESWVRAFLERLWHDELDGENLEAVRQAYDQGVPLVWLMEQCLKGDEPKDFIEYLIEEGASPYELSQDLEGTPYASLVEVHLVDDEGEPIDD